MYRRRRGGPQVARGGLPTERLDAIGPNCTRNTYTVTWPTPDGTRRLFNLFE